MTNLNILEELRTKEEVLNYFKQLGKNITEEELEALKQSYSKVQENDDVLTMQQLDDVAGGNFIFILDRAGNVLAYTHKNAIRMFPANAVLEDDEPYNRTCTCCNYEGDALDEGTRFSFGRHVKLPILGSDQEEGNSFVGRLRVSDSSKSRGWRNLANFTEGMTDDQFQSEYEKIGNELEQIYQDPDVITLIHTDGFLSTTGPREPLEFSHNSNIDFLHISHLADYYYKGFIHQDLVSNLVRCLAELRNPLLIECMSRASIDSLERAIYEEMHPNFSQEMLDLLDRYIINFPTGDSSTSKAVGERPLKRARK